MRLYPKFRSNLNTVVMPCFILFYEKNGMGAGYLAHPILILIKVVTVILFLASLLKHL